MSSLKSWRIYADVAQALIHTARQLCLDEDFGIELQHTVYALDATTIDLCLSVFPWARFRTTKGAIKLHTLFEKMPLDHILTNNDYNPNQPDDPNQLILFD